MRGSLVNWLRRAFPGAGARRDAEEWLRSRPWVAAIDRLSAEGGPVPLPQPVQLYAQVRAVPGINRGALPGIRAELETYAAEQRRWVTGIDVELDCAAGRVPITGSAQTNDDLFALLDPVLAEPRTRRIELSRRGGRGLTVTVEHRETLAYATWLSELDPGQAADYLTLRTEDDLEVITTHFGHADRLHALEPVLARARSRAQLLGFRSHTAPTPPVLQLTLASRDGISEVFRDLWSHWPERDLALTVRADRLGVRGSPAALDRLSPAAALLDGTPSLDLDLTPDGLSARVREATAITAAAAALGAHPEATGDGRTTLRLAPSSRLTLEGTPDEVARFGGPGQAVIAASQRRAYVRGKSGVLRFTVTLVEDFPALCGAIRAAGWPGTIDFFADGWTWSASYTSTATGRAEKVVVHPTGSAIMADRARAWVSAWNATAAPS